MNVIARRMEESEMQVVEESPFCQLVNRDISVDQCLDMQGQSGCFGCASTSRRCEACSLRRVDVPAVGMCGQCILSELEKEKVLSVPTDHDKRSVDCQIMKREIRVATCLATQGEEGCQGCPALSRICEKCKKHPSRFPRYGLCLSCSIEDYGDGWDPADVTPEDDSRSDRTEAWDTDVLRKIATRVIKLHSPDTVLSAIHLIPDGGNTGSFLVIGADRLKLESHVLRDSRIRYWSAKDIREDGMIPDGVEKVVSCSAEVKRIKNSLLQKLIALARGDGRQIQFCTVPSQDRLKEVLEKELKYKPAPPSDLENPAMISNQLIAPASATPVPLVRLVVASAIKEGKPSLAERMNSAITKIREGCAELQEITSQVNDMGARLELLIPLERAVLQVADEAEAMK